ncbi:hypothetical protein F383_21115 [Gossypium arboreum]|uniref:Uncharacterized protein n=1 Tax=Gossypium arboreum TaxID=29729 RepID=A0A0B0P0E2_GOSAR|nr:hypothetical protein F383_21115 [Gossypium arboreum]
MFELRHVMN